MNPLSVRYSLHSISSVCNVAQHKKNILQEGKLEMWLNVAEL